MVAGRDSVETETSFEIEKGSVTEAAPGAFAARGERHAWFDSQEVEGNSELATERLAKRCVAIRLFTSDAVVNVGRGEVEREVIAPQEVEESGRVGAAGKGYEHLLAHQVGKGGQKVSGEFCEGHGSS
jgi:hypothetical protein